MTFRPSEETERRARAQLRQTRYLRALENAGLATAAPDFSKAARAEDLDIIKLGGDPRVYERLGDVWLGEIEGEKLLQLSLEALVSGMPVQLEQPGQTAAAEQEDEPVHEADLKSLGLDPRLARCRTESQMRAALNIKPQWMIDLERSGQQERK